MNSQLVTYGIREWISPTDSLTTENIQLIPGKYHEYREPYKCPEATGHKRYTGDWGVMGF